MTVAWRSFTVIACLLAFIAGCNSDSTMDESEKLMPLERKSDVEVIAYFHGDTGDIRDYAIGDLTQIIYSFLHLDGNRLSIDSDQQREDILRLVSLKEDYPDLKILVALGGWGGCESCSEVFSSVDGREEFAASALDLLAKYDLDGLDLDWEYPAIEGFPGHTFKHGDKQNFTALLRTLRDTLGDGYDISFAAGATTEFLENSVEWMSVMPLVDRVNLMTYDLVSGDSVVTGHHTPLFSTPSQAASVDSAVGFLLILGVDPKKIVIGAAFYARVWQSVETLNDDVLYRTANFKEFVAYRDHAEYFSNDCVTQWDAQAQAPYCYNPGSDIFGTFDDRRSVALKTRYALDQGLGGIMFWQLTQDTVRGGLLSSIAEIRSSETAGETE